MIRHTVVFALKHQQGSVEEKRFLEDALVLAGIPKVRNLERLRQVSGAAEMKWIDDWSVAATFESEFSHVTRSYAGKGTVRYAW